jgi:hypothetical protein
MASSTVSSVRVALPLLEKEGQRRLQPGIVWWLVSRDDEEWWRRIDAQIEKRRVFALGVVLAQVDSTLAGGSREELMRSWLRPRRAEIGTWCVGVAYIAAPMSGVGRRIEEDHRWLWGCAVAAVRDVVSADMWLRVQLRERLQPSIARMPQ